MITEIQQLIDEYKEWLKNKISLREIDEWVEISTPYLDRHNDYIQIYARKENGGFLLTDDGHTIADLEQCGCKLETPKRQDLLKMTLNGFGVRLHETAIQVSATKDNFALRKHNLVQAILAIGDMFYLAAPMVTSIFYEDVCEWLDNHEIRYTPKVKFSGKTGYDHHFDIVIPKTRKEPERIIQTVNRPTRETTQAMIMAWIDTKEVRLPDSKAYAILNDTEQSITRAITDALQSYEVKPVLWSKRDEMLEKLSA